jgi:hypothetical protein
MISIGILVALWNESSAHPYLLAPDMLRIQTQISSVILRFPELEDNIFRSKGSKDESRCWDILTQSISDGLP